MFVDKVKGNQYNLKYIKQTKRLISRHHVRIEITLLTDPNYFVFFIENVLRLLIQTGLQFGYILKYFKMMLSSMIRTFVISVSLENINRL